MSIIPAFEAGVWNAWILIVIFLCFFTLSQFFGDIGKKIAHGEEEKTLSKFTALLAVIMWIYAIFLPLKTGTAWLYAGIAIYVIAMIIGISAAITIAGTESGKPFTTGMYRYSRHPLSFNMFVALLGIGIATASWLYLLLLVILMVLTHFQVVIEERSCSTKFGDTYREYMNRTPRWIGIPKS
jgi:protein-S-isoprenylcysteine O-methyltransferase Ste14